MLDGVGSDPESSLPAEEIDVLQLHMEGLSDQAIARRLGVSLATVRRRAARARERTRSRTRAEAIARLAAAGLLRLEPVSTSSHEEAGGASRTSQERPTGAQS